MSERRLLTVEMVCDVCCAVISIKTPEPNPNDPDLRLALMREHCWHHLWVSVTVGQKTYQQSGHACTNPACLSELAVRFATSRTVPL